MYIVSDIAPLYHNQHFSNPGYSKREIKTKRERNKVNGFEG